MDGAESTAIQCFGEGGRSTTAQVGYIPTKAVQEGER